MSTEPSTEAADLQFEKAEFSEPLQPPACTGCAKPLEGGYFEVNGSLLCRGCKEEVEKQLTGGSGARRFLVAAALGTLAAGLGAALWYAVREFTGYEIGLLSIVIGIGVGKAVRRGSSNRGGWAYQALAVFLTYSAVAMTYVPAVAQGLMASAQETDAQAADAAAPSLGDETGAPVQAAAAPGLGDETGAQVQAAAAPEAEEPSGGGVAAALAMFGLVILGIAYAAPFLSGVENLMGLLIIGFGLFEAWRINRKTALVINGPLQLAAAPAAPQPAATEPAATEGGSVG